MHQVFTAVPSRPLVFAICRLLLAIGLLDLGLASVATAEASSDDPADAVRTGNTILRDYFLERYLELHGERTLFPGSSQLEEEARQTNDPMAEQFINTQVSQFMKDLEEKLGAMKSTVTQLDTIGRDAASDGVNEDPATRARVRELAQDVGDRAGDLYKMVATVVIDLRPKDQLAPPPSSSGPQFLGDALRFLRKQVGKAEGRLKALFLAPTNTVDLDELRGDNVLTELKSIEQVSKDIRKKVGGSEGRPNLAE